MKTAEKNIDYFGLDIGTTGLRVVQLQGGEANPELKVYGSVSYPADLSQSDKKKLGKFIKQSVADIGISTEHVVASIPNRYAFTTLLVCPQMDSDELHSFVMSKAPELLPMSLESVRLDWHVINPDKNGEMEVLLVAASAEAVEHFVEVIKASGLQIHALEINALAMARSVVGAGDSAIAVVDLGMSDTEITAIWQRAPHVISSIDTGMNALVSSVQGSFNVDEEEASGFLHRFGFLESKLEGQVLQAVSNDMSGMVTKIQDVIKSFIDANPGRELKKVVLTGSPVSLPGLPTYIANQLGMPVEIANPWENVVYPAVEHDKLMNDSLYFSVAVGLAQRDFI